MARSLLRQLEQIRRSATYTDAVTWDSPRSNTAEPTVSGSLQEDLNVIRTLMQEMRGSTDDWFATMPTYEDPTATDVPKSVTFNNIKENTLDANTIILAVSDYGASDAGFTVSGTSTGILRTITTDYATTIDTIGLPIFLSVTHSGSYHDEGGADNVCRVDVIDQDNNEMQDGSGNVIYGKFYDGADDVGGTDGDGTTADVYVKFFADDAETDLSTVDPAPTAVKFVYPHRKRLSDMEEWEWLRTDFISSWEGDVELVEDISNLWSYTGSSDGVSDPTWNPASTGGNFMLQADPSDLTTAIDTINTEVGSRVYPGTYLTSDDTITKSLNDLDAQVKINADGISASSGDKYVESMQVQADANAVHALPAAIVSAGGYTPDDTAGSEGKNMDVYVDGQLLAADTGPDGDQADRDYAEVTTSGIKFRFNVQIGRNVTYVIRQ